MKIIKKSIRLTPDMIACNESQDFEYNGKIYTNLKARDLEKYLDELVKADLIPNYKVTFSWNELETLSWTCEKDRSRTERIIERMNNKREKIR